MGKFMRKYGRQAMPIVTVDVYQETYKKLVPFAEYNRRGMKGLVNDILNEWVSTHKSNPSHATK